MASREAIRKISSWERIKLYFVVKYIKNCLCHERSHVRSRILQALTDGMRETFYEDNIQTRFSVLIEWLLSCDSDFVRLALAQEHKPIKPLSPMRLPSVFTDMVMGCIAEGVYDAAKGVKE